MGESFSLKNHYSGRREGEEWALGESKKRAALLLLLLLSHISSPPFVNFITSLSRETPRLPRKKKRAHAHICAIRKEQNRRNPLRKIRVHARTPLSRKKTLGAPPKKIAVRWKESYYAVLIFFSKLAGKQQLVSSAKKGSLFPPSLALLSGKPN